MLGLKYRLTMIDFLNSQPLMTLLVVISLGYFIGQIKIKGFSLESSAILFVALAAGHFGLKIPDIFKSLGLALFIYSIGLQAGPKIPILFKKEGMGLNLLAFLVVALGALLTAVGIFFFNFGRDISIGIFAGALTSTPGLATAYEATQTGTTSIGYGIAYPVGVIGVILFIKFLPLLLKTNIPESEKKEQDTLDREQPQVINQLIEISNPNVYGKSIKALKFRALSDCVISRLVSGDKVEVPDGNTVLQEGDIVRVVGREENIEGAVLFLGHSTDKKIPTGHLDIKRFVVTNKKLVGKKIKDLKIRMRYEANITRVGRFGLELIATPDLELHWGDRVSVVSEIRFMDALKHYFGDDIKKAEEGNVFSVILGIMIGISIGLIPVSIGKFFSIKLGLTGGILMAGLILSNRKRLGPIVWRVPFNIINFMREMGLIFFLAAVGTKAGESFLAVIRENGLPMLLWSAVITTVPMFTVLFLSLKKFHLNLFQLFGLLPGSMTSTPGFATATTITSSPTPAAIYATVYPVAMIAMIIWVKILVLIPF
jgi:putative transport protein